MFILFLSIVKMHIYSDKTTYLVGENIYLGCEITNTGSDVAFVEKFLFSRKLLSEDAEMWDTDGRKVSHNILIGTPFRIAGKKYNKATKMLEPGKSIRFKELSIIGNYGTALFCKSGFYNKYIPSGEYFFSIQYWVKERGRLKKVSSDTLHIHIQKPTGEEKRHGRYTKSSERERGPGRLKI